MWGTVNGAVKTTELKGEKTRKLPRTSQKELPSHHYSAWPTAAHSSTLIALSFVERAQSVANTAQHPAVLVGFVRQHPCRCVVYGVLCELRVFPPILYCSFFVWINQPTRKSWELSKQFTSPSTFWSRILPRAPRLLCIWSTRRRSPEQRSSASRKAANRSATQPFLLLRPFFENRKGVCAIRCTSVVLVVYTSVMAKESD